MKSNKILKEEEIIKNNKHPYRHGELTMKIVESLPAGAILKLSTNKHIVAHSETGHHHVLVADKPFNVYEHNGQTYIMTMKVAELVHEKTGKDVHKTHKIQPAIYQINIKKEFNYFTGLLQSVRD
tara:strand:+ start:15428 stop:15802 length:375 start_codon:yes stop_codon:yes gene_type:complete